MHKGTRSGVLPICAVVIALCAATILWAQTKASETKKPIPKKQPTAKSTLQQARADSLAAAIRADSLRTEFRAAALADSISRVREDSLRMFHYRKVNNEAFGTGERLVFDVNYGFITAGEAVMAVSGVDSIASRKCYRVEFTVNSLPSFSWIYKVEDQYLTFIDVEAIAPLKFEQHIREGTYRRDFVAEFDQARGIAKTSEGEFPIPEYVHDIMSAFYYARTLDFTNFTPGQGTLLHNFYKDKSYDLQVRFLGRQELEVAAGTFKTIVVEPLVKEGGLFKSEGRIVIWLSDDERKIPVRVNTKVVIGSIDTELRSYSGLVGPLKARVK